MLQAEGTRDIFRINPATIFQGEEVTTGTTTIGATNLAYTHYRRRGTEFFYYENVQNNLGGVFKRGTDGLLATEVTTTGTTSADLVNNESDSSATNIFTLLDG